MRASTFIFIYLVLLIGGFCSLSYAEVDSVDRNVQPNQAIPFKTEKTTSDVSLTRVMVVLVVAIGLSLAAILMLKKFLLHKEKVNLKAGGRISVLETRRVTPKLVMVLVKVDNEEYLLAQSEHQLQMTRHGVGMSKEDLNDQH